MVKEILTKQLKPSDKVDILDRSSLRGYTLHSVQPNFLLVLLWEFGTVCILTDAILLFLR